MSRVARWRSRCPEEVRLRQESVLNPGAGPDSLRLFLLRRSGPAAFVIKEEGERQKLKVSLGDPHTCSCSIFRLERELCKHLCWCLLKVFRLNQQDSLSYQLGLVPREISHLLQGRNNGLPQIPDERGKGILPSIKNDNEECKNSRRVAMETDICPICLENILESHLPVTHCRHGCGNLVHISCMVIWGKHSEPKESNGELMLRCPLCRGNFGTQRILNEESRNAPRVRFPKRLQRLVSDVLRQQNDRWHENCREQKAATEKMDKKDLAGFLPPIEPARQRHGEHDEKSNVKYIFQTSKEDLLRSLPFIRIHKSHRLLVKGQQCCICLSPYQRGELARTLPICGHSFHSGCLKRWTENHGLFAVCPIDGSCIATATSERFTDNQEAVSEKASSGMSTKPPLEQGKLSEEALKSLSSTFIVKRLLIPENQQYESRDHNSAEKEEGKGKDGNDERTVTKERRRSKKSLRPSPPPLLIQLCPRNPSVETSAASSSENVPVAEKEEYRVACRKRATVPRLPGYIPVAAVDLAAVGPCLSVKALPVQPMPNHEAAAVSGAAARSPSRLSQRTPQKPEALRCHRYQNPPQPLLWSHHRAKHSHQQYGGEARDLAEAKEASQGKLLQCSRMRLSSKSHPVRGHWDDMFWDSTEGSVSEYSGRPSRKDF